MNRFYTSFIVLLSLISCDDTDEGTFMVSNPEVTMDIPIDFPALNYYFEQNKPTEYGVILGKKLFNEKRFSRDNTISCASCHMQVNAFTDNREIGIGIQGRIGLRNTPPIQNLAFMNFYNWDGSKLQLESQAIVPIITHEEMNSSMVEAIDKIKYDEDYKELFFNAFGNEQITSENIFKSIAQYEYTLLSSNSKYDQVKRGENTNFTESEINGYDVFQRKCMACHNTELFTDQTFRNIGFPQNTNTEESGRARVTGEQEDLYKFRVPSLRNIEYTAPYGSFGQFSTLEDVLDYLNDGVIDAENLDSILKSNNNRIPLSEQEKSDLIAFMKTLSDEEFIQE